MLDTRLYEAVLSEARCEAGLYRVYGRTMAPFSLRHSLQLEALDSPLFTGEPWSEFDLQVAAEICSRRELTPRPSKPGVWRHLRHRRGVELAAFYEYFEACYARPELYEAPESGGGSTLHAPLELIIVTYLVRKTSVTEERAWTMPAGLAFWMFESIKEQETGESDIITDQIKADMEAQNSPEEVAAAERNARYFRALEAAMQSPEPDIAARAAVARAEFLRTAAAPPEFDA